MNNIELYEFRMEDDNVEEKNHDVERSQTSLELAILR
jgi:hypothetical protein